MSIRSRRLRKRDLMYLVGKYRDPELRKAVGTRRAEALESAASDLEFLVKGGRIVP